MDVGKDALAAEIFKLVHHFGLRDQLGSLEN